MTSEALETAQYLTFALAGEEFAIDILRVKEIIEYTPPTTVPMTPASIRGVINVRGSVVPVVDLAVRFGLPPGEVTKRSCIVIVEVDLGGENAMMGIVTDAVNEVTYLTADDIEPPPNFGTQVAIEFLLGFGKIDERFVLLLDVNRVLSAEEFEALVAAQIEEAEVEAADGEAEVEAVHEEGA
jgi:purine-binding chemotaxis protein CheW